MLAKLSRIELLNFLGVVGGGLFPVAFVIAAHSIEPLTSSEMFSIYLFTTGLFVVISGACIFVATVGEKDSRPRRVEVALVISAVVSVICLTIFVLTTGGPFASPFSFHYLYIPVVTGLCLGRDALKTACIGCGLLFLGCALGDRFWLSQLSWSVSANAQMLKSSSYFVAYVSIFYLQLAITYIMAKETVLADVHPLPAAPAPAVVEPVSAS